MVACRDLVIICEHFLMRKVAAEMCLCMYIRWKLKWGPERTFVAISEHFALEKKRKHFRLSEEKRLFICLCISINLTVAWRDLYNHL